MVPLNKDLQADKHKHTLTYFHRMAVHRDNIMIKFLVFFFFNVLNIRLCFGYALLYFFSSLIMRSHTLFFKAIIAFRVLR